MTRPVPHPDLVTAPYWKSAQEGVFALPRCEGCSRHHFYPRGNCPHCGSPKITWTPASGRGEVYSFSVVHRAPNPAFRDEVPYVVAIVKTAEGPHLLSRVTNVAPESVRIGMKVKAKIERFEDVLLPVFEPEAA